MQPTPSSRGSRSGFTLVELLVVIAIIGILVALLLPAVQAAREAARRSQCSNNLKQIGLAIQNYHDSTKLLPPGHLNCPNHPVCSGGVNITAPWITNWAIGILPYMEQQTLADKYNHNLINWDAANQFVIQTFLETQICPSDVNTKSLILPESGPNSAVNYAPGSYVAISGVTPAAGGTNWDEGNPNPQTNRGVFSVIWPTGPSINNLAAVTDGTSNTLFIGEYHTKSHNRRRKFWADSYTSYNTGSVLAGSPTAFGVPDYDACSAAPPLGAGANANDCKRSLASLHPGGMNFALGDGSVRFVAKTIDRTILAGVATLQGGEPVQVP